VVSAGTSSSKVTSTSFFVLKKRLLIITNSLYVSILLNLNDYKHTYAHAQHEIYFITTEKP
ncbi:hypothetical protein, partial [Vibrio sp. V26_P1S5P106]|uniref:hypothetical protein n=1 Tax=Vibrio sp. V26_P1S5P106 TaxID=1938678 RepID=UPI001F45EBA4